jgi:hypothetical protein
MKKVLTAILISYFGLCFSTFAQDKKNQIEEKEELNLIRYSKASSAVPPQLKPETTYIQFIKGKDAQDFAFTCDTGKHTSHSAPDTSGKNKLFLKDKVSGNITFPITQLVNVTIDRTATPNVCELTVKTLTGIAENGQTYNLTRRFLTDDTDDATPPKLGIVLKIPATDAPYKQFNCEAIKDCGE